MSIFFFYFYDTKKKRNFLKIVQSTVRQFSDGPNVATLKGGENILHTSLQKHFPLAKEIKIKDISGNYVL